MKKFVAICLIISVISVITGEIIGDSEILGLTGVGNAAFFLSELGLIIFGTWASVLLLRK